MEHRRAIVEHIVGRSPERILSYGFFEDDDLDAGLREYFSAGSTAMGWSKGGELVTMKCRVCGAVVDRNTVGIVTGTVGGGTDGFQKPKDNMYAMPVCPTEECQGLSWPSFAPA